MNELVSIKEGGLTRELSPIDKVKADNTDGTQSIWVSKDDMHTGTLYATENGIYIASEDGYDAYDEVLIRVTDESYDGGNEWKDVDPDVDRYTWDDTTYQDYKIDPDSFDDKFNDPTKWKDEDLGDNLDYKYNDGNSISGIDPETGKPVEYSVDEDGFLDEEALPWEIEITRLPDRTEFYDGHRIVFSGIKVCAVTDVDGEDVYKPIPYNELIFPVTIAKIEGGDSSRTVPIGNPYNIGSFVFYKGSISGVRYTGASLSITGNGVFLNVTANEYVDSFMASKKPIDASDFSASGTTETTFNRIHDSGAYTKDGKSAYFARIVNENGFGTRFSGSGINFSDIGLASWVALYGGYDKKIGTQNIPVQWISPDGEMLEDSYTITVLQDPSGGGSGGDSGGDSGGISYGGKDYMLNPNSVVGLSYDADSKKVIAPNIGEYNIDQAIDVGLLISKE